MSAKRYFLDTSAQVERNGGTKRSEMKQLLKDGGHMTSSQVLREWNRIVFEVCSKLRNALDTSDDWIEVVAQLRNDWGSRRVGLNWLVTELIHCGDTSDLGVVAMRLSDFERARAERMFQTGVSDVRDGTGCSLIHRRPYKAKGKWRYASMCKKTDDICCQPDFFDGEMNRAKAAASALEGSQRDADRAMGKKAMAALVHSAENSTKGKACHAKNGLGGDICIALECAADEVLLTTDKSFDLICPAIGITHERI